MFKSVPATAVLALLTACGSGGVSSLTPLVSGQNGAELPPIVVSGSARGADHMVVSNIYQGDGVNRSQCRKTQCTFDGGATLSFSDVTFTAPASSQTVRTNGGITLVDEQVGNAKSLGARLQHSAFNVTTGDFTRAMAFGDQSPPDLLQTIGTLRYTGVMAGAYVTGDDKGDRVSGHANVNFNVRNEGDTVDVTFSNIVNMNTGVAVAPMGFENIGIGRERTFGAPAIQGSFYGPNRDEVGGVFEKDGIVGAFGSTRFP